jgi:hypothetical protein
MTVFPKPSVFPWSSAGWHLSFYKTQGGNEGKEIGDHLNSRTITHLQSSKCKTSTNSFSNGATTRLTATTRSRTTSKGTTRRMEQRVNAILTQKIQLQHRLIIPCTFNFSKHKFKIILILIFTGVFLKMFIFRTLNHANRVPCHHNMAYP